MFRRIMIAIATVAALGISFATSDSFAAPRHGGSYHGGGHYGYHGGGWRGGRGWGGFGAGILGGMLAAPYYYGPYDYYPESGYVPEDSAIAYCMQRFRSYDPNSGTYLGYDGLRHPCP